jgi:hypothetical protein
VSAARAGSTDAGRRCAVPASVRDQVPELLLGLPHPCPSVYFSVPCSVADPNPDPRVFGPPASGSISQRYESGSGSFYH